MSRFEGALVHKHANAPTRAEPRRWWVAARLQRPSPEVQASWNKATELIDHMKRTNSNTGLTDEQCEIIKSRWLGQTEMYERQWRGQRNVYYLLRVPIIIGATTVPVLASRHVHVGWTAGVGLAVALLTALDSFFQLGARWQLHRHAATELGFEGWAFISLVGRYAKKEREAAYQAFITEIETMNKKLATSYLGVFRTNAKKDREE